MELTATWFCCVAAVVKAVTAACWWWGRVVLKCQYDDNDDDTARYRTQRCLLSYWPSILTIGASPAPPAGTAATGSCFIPP
jgi:hypothetical protein